MVRNENAYTLMACRNVKRTGVISISHFAFNFEVIRCNRHGRHIGIGFGRIRQHSALAVSIFGRNCRV